MELDGDPGVGGQREAQPGRAKGRLPTQLRPLLCERGLLQRADGSAKWVQGGSAVLAAVNGPAAAGPRREDAERAVVEVVFKPRNGPAGSCESELGEVLRGAVEGVLLASLHPRTAVTLVVQVLQADGALLACAANAACAALVDAGVPLSALFASVCAAFTDSGALLLDPDASEEASAVSVLTLAFPYRQTLAAAEEGGQQQQQQQQQQAAGDGQQQPGAGEKQQQPGEPRLVVDDGALAVHATGRFSSEQLLRACEAARRGCAGVANFTRMSLLAGFKDTLQQQR
ncbi:exosome complex exonuclease [Raphidocelis subcapitata]|uniref:Exosome complex exonuclease n=1 Tax=Raphidocelis subcapitata TaxID=307507 RepID=A0A2V0P5A9_9CHLO|nr:exosome complex exonuclease [Raphidocelis subcapitata]|eukprot:GBF94102.1 exosome complex exonuclease [Raphidocelis subcapitata]